MINDKPLLPSTVSRDSKAEEEDDKTVRLSSPPSTLDFRGRLVGCIGWTACIRMNGWDI